MKGTMIVYSTDTDAGELPARIEAEQPATLILVSSARVYGASPGHDLCHDEDTPVEAEPPDLERAALVEVELAALACADSLKGLRLVILRPVHVLGGPHEGILGRAMHGAQLRTAFGFDPLMQLIHQDDIERAVELATDGDIEGVFNVCGAGALPLSELARITGTQRIAGIGGIVSDLLERASLRDPTRLPADETCYLNHVDDTRFRAVTGYTPRRTLPETVAALGKVASP